MGNTRRRAAAAAALLAFALNLAPARAQNRDAARARGREATRTTGAPSSVSPAPAVAPSEFKPTVRRVAVFKNGYVFTYREGEARPGDAGGWVYTTDVPSGVLGAVWGYTTNPRARVTQLLASEADKTTTSRVANLAELLLLNEGSRARLTVEHSDKTVKVLEGTYVVLTPQRTFPVGQGDAARPDVGGAQVAAIDIALTTGTGTTVIPASRITYVEIVGPPRWDKPVRTKEQRLAIKSEGARAGESVGLGIAALERGIRWIPAYRLEARGEPVSEAKLELEAMVINELTDVADAEFYFVVGVPHFLFRDMLSPLSLSNAFAGVSSYFTTTPNLASNYIMTQTANARMGERMNRDDSLAAPASPQVNVPGEERVPAMAADELFLYRADGLSLKKNERASVRLFSLTVPCSELFEWTIDDSTGLAESYSSAPVTRSMAHDLSRGIWYALRLKNQTGMPWTTAPVLNFRDWKPLGQDMLAFTPAGTETVVRVTPATEVTGSHKLEEKGRIRRALKDTDGYEYDLVTVEGTVNLRNLKRTAAAMRLTRPLTGEVVSTTDGGQAAREGLNLQTLNPRSVVRWEFPLPPGEKQLRYSYKVYVRSS
ncbi:MAG TPA: hypothetical protein VEQ42_06700 [Pyrinomonadaceae bacterium]|nr:hypothetical protein [Pyrinomonadaceae bacterium]